MNKEESISGLNSKLTAKDFVVLFKKATSNTQLKAIMDCLDTCYNDDESIMEPDEWPMLSKLISEIMTR